MPRVSGAGTGADRIYVTARLNRLLAQAEDEAKQLKDDYISIEHLLLAMMDGTGVAGRLFKEFGLTRERLPGALKSIRGNQRVTSQNPEATYEALARDGRDLSGRRRIRSSIRRPAAEAGDSKRTRDSLGKLLLKGRLAMARPSSSMQMTRAGLASK